MPENTSLPNADDIGLTPGWSAGMTDVEIIRYLNDLRVRRDRTRPLGHKRGNPKRVPKRRGHK